MEEYPVTYFSYEALINDLGANHRMGLSSYKEGDFERR